MRLIGSGCNVNERDGVTQELLAGQAFWFVTLTAPSFGPVHRVPKSPKSRLVQCKCGLTHRHGDVLRGVPIHQRTYRYKEQIGWNSRSDRLMKKTMDRLRELIPGVEYAFVKEWQTRGTIHLHGVVRVDASLDQTEVYTCLMSLKSVTDNGANWGREIDVKSIGESETGNSVRYMSKVVAYTSKQQGETDGIVPEARRRHYNRLDWHARRMKCPRKDCDRKNCRGKKHKEFGHSGHMMTMSKEWSLVGLTRTKLVEERKAYAASHKSTAVQQATLEQASRYKQQAIAEELTTSDEPEVNEQWKRELLQQLVNTPKRQ